MIFESRSISRNVTYRFKKKKLMVTSSKHAKNANFQLDVCCSNSLLESNWLRNRTPVAKFSIFLADFVSNDCICVHFLVQQNRPKFRTDQIFTCIRKNLLNNGFDLTSFPKSDARFVSRKKFGIFSSRTP